MLIVAKSMYKVDRLTYLLHKEFDMKDLDTAKKILSMEICRDREARELELSQKNYCQLTQLIKYYLSINNLE